MKKSQLKHIIKEITKQVLNEGISSKSTELVKKWISNGGTRKASVKIIDNILRNRIGLESSDLPDTSTFANGLDTMEELLKTGNYDDAVRLGLETAKAMIEEEGGEGIFENDGMNTNLIDGQSNNVAAGRVNKILSDMSKGMFSDNSWEPIHKIFEKLNQLGLNVNLLSAQYGGQSDTSSGVAKYKEWRISIPFTNNKGKSVQLVGQITAHGAGSVEQPLDRYDITAYVSAVNVR